MDIVVKCTNFKGLYVSFGNFEAHMAILIFCNSNVILRRHFDIMSAGTETIKTCKMKMEILDDEIQLNILDKE